MYSNFQDLTKAMKMLGLNMTDQEMVDIPNKIMRCQPICLFFLFKNILTGKATFSFLIFANWYLRGSGRRKMKKKISGEACSR